MIWFGFTNFFNNNDLVINLEQISPFWIWICPNFRDFCFNDLETFAVSDFWIENVGGDCNADGSWTLVFRNESLTFLSMDLFSKGSWINGNKNSKILIFFPLKLPLPIISPFWNQNESRFECKLVKKTYQIRWIIYHLLKTWTFVFESSFCSKLLFVSSCLQAIFMIENVCFY